MSFTVFLGNLPAWVTADDIKGWLSAENLVADAIKVIRNPETQESKGFAFIDAPNAEEMNAIIRRFDRAPLEDRLLRANPAQPPKPKGQGPGFGPGPGGRPSGGSMSSGSGSSGAGLSGVSAAATGHSTQGQASQGQAGQGQASQGQTGQGQSNSGPQQMAQVPNGDRPPRRAKKPAGGMRRQGSNGGPQSAFAEELAKAL